MNLQLNNIKCTGVLLLATLLMGSLPAVADDAARGLEIVTEMKQRDTGWKDMQAGMEMTLSNRYGESSTRAIRMKSLEVLNDGDKSLTVFDAPKDVQGTAFLSFSHTLDADDQWLYLPALKRVKRIASRNKSGPFMGSEFAYEDLSSFEVEKYRYRLLREEDSVGIPCFVVENIPVDPLSGYSRRIIWVDKSEYRIWKTEFYDRRNALLKTLTFSDYQQYLSRYWRASKMEMVNHQSGKQTTLAWRDYRFNNELSDSDFNMNTLKRAR